MYSVFSIILKKQNGVARVKNRTITYQTSTVLETGQGFGLSKDKSKQRYNIY